MTRYLASIIFVILIAVSAVFIEDACDRYPLWFSLFFTTLIAVVIFNVLNLKQWRETYVICSQNVLITIVLVVLSFAIYALCFVSTSFIGGSAYNALYFAGSGLMGYYFADKNKLNTINTITITMLFFLIGAYSIFLCINSLNVLNAAAGAILTVVGSICGFVYATYSDKISKAGLSTVQILSFRFYLLLFISLILLPENTIALISWESMLYMSVLSISGTVLPVYFFQKGILEAGVEANAIIMAFTPFATLVFTAIYKQQAVIWTEALFVVLLTIILLLPLLTYARKEREPDSDRNSLQKSE